jgi:hypothetical protein
MGAPPSFFFFGLQAQAPRVDPRAALPLAGRKRGGTWSQRVELDAELELPTAEARRSSRCALPAALPTVENGRRPTRATQGTGTVRCTPVQDLHTRRVADVLTMVKNLDLLYELFKLITEKIDQNLQ